MLALSASWTHCLIDQSVGVSNEIQWSWVQIPLTLTLYIFFKESFGGDFHMYNQVIWLHSRDYLNKISIKIIMVGGEGNSRNEI